MTKTVSKSAGRSPALFVYGSLMDRAFWRPVIGARAATTIQITQARLRGWRRSWNGVRPDLGGAVLNLARDPKGFLWGGLVTGLSEETWAKLDEQESSHLPRTRVMVVTVGGRRVWAHGYRQRIRGPERWPGPRYLRAVRLGAKRLGATASRDVEADVARLRSVTKNAAR
jgi:gamma-glutamylcyclotransferase (GGCT)/AIG2-like uncharacterized protein YtfP